MRRCHIALVCLVAFAAFFVLAAPALATEETTFVGLLNNYRATNGLEPLAVSGTLTESATRHSSDMGKYGFFGHYTVQSDWFSAGASPWARMAASGYTYNTPKGENIAAGYFTAAAVFEAWRASPDHNANMLSANFRAIGIGLVRVPGSEWGIYWTTDFGGYADPVTTTTTSTTTTLPPTTTTTAPPATTTTVPTGEAAFIDRTWLAGHHSAFTGQMVIMMRVYGLTPAWVLTITGMETGMGDTVYGGRLVGANNFGCLRNGGTLSRWGSLSSGIIWVAGKDWYTFPTPWVGMCAIGRLLKVGPTSSPGYYLRSLQAGDWAAFSRTYYGTGPGLSDYTARARAMYQKIVGRARAAGYAW